MKKIFKDQAEHLEDAAANCIDVTEGIEDLRGIDAKQDRLMEIIDRAVADKKARDALCEFYALEDRETAVISLCDYRANRAHNFVTRARQITDKLGGIFRYRAKEDEPRQAA